MADFAIIHEQDVLPVWINLDYVVRINRGLDPHEPTSIHFSDGKTIVVPRAEGDKLVAQLNLCCNPRQKQSGASPKRTPQRHK
jgi:hypothetical protein